MLRTINDRPTLWEQLLPEQCRRMPVELDAVDRLLDDDRFFARTAASSMLAVGARRSRSSAICG